MRKKFMAIILATSMMLTGISFPTSVYAANSIKQKYYKTKRIHIL